MLAKQELYHLSYTSKAKQYSKKLVKPIKNCISIGGRRTSTHQEMANCGCFLLWWSRGWRN
jgi:hypothetical protein